MHSRVRATVARERDERRAFGSARNALGSAAMSVVLEPGRSETFPYPERIAARASPFGSICYFDAGAPSARPPIVFLHALGTNLTHWEYVAPILAPHTRLIGMDLIGCGHSARLDDGSYSLGMMTDAVVALLDHLDVAEAIVVGHSFGGRIAVDLALRQRRRVAGLALLNPSGLTRFPPAVRVAVARMTQPWMLYGAIRYGAPALMSRLFGESNARTQRFIDQALGRPDYDFVWDFARYACPMLDDILGDTLDVIGAIDTPTVVVCGERDALVNPHDVKLGARRIPGAEVVALPRSGHLVNIEDPEPVAAAILGLLARA